MGNDWESTKEGEHTRLPFITHRFTAEVADCTAAQLQAGHSQLAHLVTEPVTSLSLDLSISMMSVHYTVFTSHGQFCCMHAQSGARRSRVYVCVQFSMLS